MNFAALFRRQLLAGASCLVLMIALPAAHADDAERANAFYNAGGYTYCDAKLLATQWNKSPWESKVFAGNKITNGRQDNVEHILMLARQAAGTDGIGCTFQDADNPVYTYDDAVLLAKHWGKETPEEAKVKIGELLEAGENSNIIALLKGLK